jgi:hypothetical protein
VPHMPQEPGLPVQDGSEPEPAMLEAKTESFFDSLAEPQCGHGVPSHLLERTSTSLSFPHFPQ